MFLSPKQILNHLAKLTQYDNEDLLQYMYVMYTQLTMEDA